MHYFAFGSNLNPEQMAARCPGHEVVGMAALRDHRLDFPVHSRDWDGGVAGVHVAHGDIVWGIVYALNDVHIASLDGYEGYHGAGDPRNLYERERIWVDLTRPDDGSIPRRLRAEIYVVANLASPAPPSRRYLDTILAGARHHHLPEEYIAALARIATAN
jgi:gamma-glutamylcyclotransferase (GGCT)/AIG2-like uncharacterized protein YtfP